MKFISIFFVVSVLISCNSVKKTQQAMSSGNYMEAINRSVSRLQRNKSNNKAAEYAQLLKLSFENYRDKTLDRIDFLKRETLNNNSKSIYDSYFALRNIQNKIKPLLPLVDETGRQIDFQFYDFSDEIIDARENYAEFLYQNAKQRLDKNDKMSSREAYNNFLDLEQLTPEYKNSYELKQQAYLKGLDYVLVSMYNETQQVIPKLLEERILNFNTYELDDFWTEFHQNSRSDINYDFAIDIVFTGFDFSPERLLERQLPLERDVVDGWRYKKDRQGNFILNDRGEKIKEDVIIHAEGTLFETIQSKEVIVKAEVNYFDLIADQKIKSYPLESVFVFENRFADFEGNEKVLTDQERILLTRGPVEYPSNEMMLLDASEDIKAKLKFILNQEFNN